KLLIERGKTRVKASAIATKPKTAKDLPTTNCHKRTGKMSKISNVPLCCSSLHCRMVRDAAKKIITTDNHWNKARTSALPTAQHVSTQKKSAKVAAKKTPTNITASGELK